MEKETLCQVEEITLHHIKKSLAAKGIQLPLSHVHETPAPLSFGNYLLKGTLDHQHTYGSGGHSLTTVQIIRDGHLLVTSNRLLTWSTYSDDSMDWDTGNREWTDVYVTDPLVRDILGTTPQLSKPRWYFLESPLASLHGSSVATRADMEALLFNSHTRPATSIHPTWYHPYGDAFRDMLKNPDANHVCNQSKIMLAAAQNAGILNQLR
jgi:hypothetical protein